MIGSGTLLRVPEQNNMSHEGGLHLCGLVPTMASVLPPTPVTAAGQGLQAHNAKPQVILVTRGQAGKGIRPVQGCNA
jgi:hypothetical protein